MRRILVGVLVLGAGCHSAERQRAPGRFAGRDAAPDASPERDWAAPKPGPQSAAQTPKGDTLAGFVALPDGTPARNVAVEIELGIGEGAPVEVRTDKEGYFRIPGLKPQQSYTLTARAAQNGTRYTGKLYARTGTAKSQHVRIEMVEGGDAPPATGTGLPPPDRTPLPKFTPDDLNLPGPSAAATPPGGFVETLPPPLTAQTLPGDAPPTVTPPPPLVAAPRQDLRVQSEAPYAPPLASVPPLTVVPPLRGPATRGESVGARKLPTGTEFTLTDAAGVPRDFPTGRWLLLDFMTTTCGPCQKSVPLLSALQERYAADRLDVVGLVCDDADARTRRRLMTEYARRHAPGYPLLTEPSDEPGALLNRFRVESYPTLILLDGEGKEVWRGHPAEAGELGRWLRR